jgi:hypothetical protein
MWWTGSAGALGPWLVGVLALCALISACGGGETKSVSRPGGGSAAGDLAAGPVTVVTTDNKFDTTSLTATANQAATLTLTNKGEAIHSWHVLTIKDRDGKEITTKLLNKGAQETVTFTLATPGT